MTDLLRLLALYRPWWGWIVVSILVSLVATLANVGLMAVSGWFVTAMAVAGLGSGSMNYFTPAAIIRALAIVRTGGRWLDRVIGHEATFRLIAATRVWLFARLERIAPAGLGALRSGDVAARLKGDIDRLELVFLRLIAPLAVAVASGLVATVVLATYDGAMAMALAIALVFGGLLAPGLVAVAARGSGERVTAISAEIRAKLVDDLDGLSPLLLTGDAQRRIAALDRRYGDLATEEARLARWSGAGQVGVGLAADLAVVAILAIGIPLVGTGRLAGPDLTLAALLALSVFEAFVGVPAAFAGLAATLASARRIFALADRKPTVVDAEHPRDPADAFDLVFDHVGLAHPGASRPALVEIDLAIAECEHVAIVGASGAGKSSLVDLLVRFRDPTAGEIRLGGVPLGEIGLEALRRRFTVVAQDPHLFSTTIEENLRLARPDASDDDLARALEAAQLATTVAAMPQGAATPIGQAGSRLSGGEVRRLALARALLAEAPILILDEPTEGLDPDTARRLLDTVLDSAQGRTVILFTHHRIALERMDVIVTLDAGRIVDDGAHHATQWDIADPEVGYGHDG